MAGACNIKTKDKGCEDAKELNCAQTTADDDVFTKLEAAAVTAGATAAAAKTTWTATKAAYDANLALGDGKCVARADCGKKTPKTVTTVSYDEVTSCDSKYFVVALATFSSIAVMM